MHSWSFAPLGSKESLMVQWLGFFDGFLEVWVTRDVNSVGHRTQCLARLIWFISILKGSIIDTTCVSKATSLMFITNKQNSLGHIVGHEPKKEWIMEAYDWWMLWLLWDWLPTYNTSEPLRTGDPLSVVDKGFSFYQLLSKRLRCVFHLEATIHKKLSRPYR